MVGDPRPEWTGLTRCAPESVEQLIEVVRDSPSVHVSLSPAEFCLPTAHFHAWHAFTSSAAAAFFKSHPDRGPAGSQEHFEELSRLSEEECAAMGGIAPGSVALAVGRNLDGIVSYSPADQVATVRAGTNLHTLQAELGKADQCIPLPDLEPLDDVLWNYLNYFQNVTIGSAIALNLPNPLQSQCGSWRDWVLGVRFVTADGTLVHGGSEAVKNVAGYDLQKLMIGARHTLGVLVEVTLRTLPVKARPALDLQVGPALKADLANRQELWVQRTQPSDFDRAMAAAGDRLLFADRGSATLWAVVPDEETISRYEGDWVLRSNCGVKNLELNDPTLVRFMRRAKDLFDPTHKLNPGEVGIL